MADHKQPDYGLRYCQTCSKEFTARTSTQIFCSEPCGLRRAPQRPCVICGQLFKNISPTKYCSKKCAHGAIRICRHCQCKFKLTRSHRQAYCSDECKKAAFKARLPEY